MLDRNACLLIHDNHNNNEHIPHHLHIYPSVDYESHLHLEEALVLGRLMSIP
jgi:hypothetical protein